MVLFFPMETFPNRNAETVGKLEIFIFLRCRPLFRPSRPSYCGMLIRSLSKVCKGVSPVTLPSSFFSADLSKNPRDGIEDVFISRQRSPPLLPLFPLRRFFLSSNVWSALSLPSETILCFADQPGFFPSPFVSFVL